MLQKNKIAKEYLFIFTIYSPLIFLFVCLFAFYFFAIFNKFSGWYFTCHLCWYGLFCGLVFVVGINEKGV